jgi:fructokinase
MATLASFAAQAANNSFTLFTGNEFVADLHLTGSGAPYIETPVGYHLGGSHAFIALAATKIIRDDQLNGNVFCLGKISKDSFGQDFYRALTQASVVTSFLRPSAHGTLIAIVKKQEGKENEFMFPNINKNAIADFHSNDLPDFEAHKNKIFCLGSITATTQPAANTWLQCARARYNDSLILFDLNTRAPFIKNMDQHKLNLLDWAATAHIMKASDADIYSVYGPNTCFDEIAALWQTAGAKVVVITRGSKGPLLYAHSFCIELPVPTLHCTNTVGAGDNFFSGLSLAFASKGCFTGQSLDDLQRQDFQDILKRAIRASEKHLISLGATYETGTPPSDIGSNPKPKI